ncbi:Organic radical activating enzyme [Polynucleobacter duraquae]|uniref:Organic radical activating enzyme n=1 Tax=Polynucleobacter duraquae TaxID=1835254 RepID=A0A0E3ZM04_9BURK|nr:radical SAM protein [Polynucleobacter duraquae]AKD25231.1 Organic radical activating enzyme [Polynucleobacter duraquae]
MKSYAPHQIVKSCSRIESGLRLAHDGVRACTFSTGAVEAPNYWGPDEIPLNLTKQMIVDKRRALFERLNDPNDNDFLCRKCTHWVEKEYKEIRFDQLEFVNVAHFSACNLRCNYCGFTKNNDFKKEKYSALNILKHFDAKDVTFEASVDFNAGEPTLMKDLDEHLIFFRENKMRVRLYSNGIIFSQAVYDAVKDGTITWLIISVDAGTPSTYFKTKKSNC